MEKEIDKGVKEFCEMFNFYIKKKMLGRISFFIKEENDWVSMSFREGPYMLFTLYLGEEKKILLFTNLKRMYSELYIELRDLFTYLGFVIEDKAK